MCSEEVRFGLKPAKRQSDTTESQGFETYEGSSDNATLEVTLVEERFYHIPDHVEDIPARGYKVLSELKLNAERHFIMLIPLF